MIIQNNHSTLPAIRLVVTDLDETLFNAQSIISNQNIQAIHHLKSKGIQFAIASGRAVSVVEKIASQHGILQALDFIIGFNGAILGHLKTPSHIHLPHLSKEVIRLVVSQFSQVGLAFAVHEGNKLIASHYSDAIATEQTLNDYELVIVEDFAAFIDKDYPKLMLVGTKALLDDLDPKVTAFRGEMYHSFRSHGFFLEIVAPGVSKGETLMHYCREQGILAEEVMAVGDNANDIEMIDFAGYGVAVDNAVIALKAKAKYITHHHNEDGFAEAVRHFIP